MTVTSSPAGEHAGARHTVDTLTSDALDELYDDRDQLRAQLSDMTRDRDQWKWYRDDAERRVRVQRARAETAETALAALRKEQDEYEENVVGDLNEANIGLARKAARAEAAVARVHAALAAFDGRGVIAAGAVNLDIPTAGEVLSAVRAALEEPDDCPRTTADNSPTSSDTPDNPLEERIRALIEDEMYEYRERAMWWPEGEIAKEIARLATRGAMEALTGGQASAHIYLSTGCLHGDHAYCQSMTGLNGAKRPASCKKCGAACICPCHTTKEP